MLKADIQLIFLSMLHCKIHKHDTNKDWICFIHGAGGSSSVWFKQVKFFKEHFNLILIDLRGHGKSVEIQYEENPNVYTIQLIIDDILEVLAAQKIEKAHFFGVSLGTILIKELSYQFPDKVASMVLGGAVCKLDLKARFLLVVASFFYRIIPYMVIYKLAAFIVLPRKNHELSRLLFIREAQKLNQLEFNKWFKLLSKSTPLLKKLRAAKVLVPTLYVMGEQDYMFLTSVKNMLKKNKKDELQVIKSCGHVVNFEQYDYFNQLSLNFVNKVVLKTM